MQEREDQGQMTLPAPTKDGELVDRETGEVIDNMPAIQVSNLPVPIDPGYTGLSLLDLDEAQETRLAQLLPDEEIDILPTGECYVQQVRYRRILNETFGPGRWALVQRGRWFQQDNTLISEFALYVQGHFVSAAFGEADYFENNKRMSYATAAESAKSNALTRTCKDLGIASQCWDRRYTEAWKQQFAVKVWVKGRDRPQWRRKDAELFFGETEPVDGTQPAAKAAATAGPKKSATESAKDALKGKAKPVEAQVAKGPVPTVTPPKAAPKATPVTRTVQAPPPGAQLKYDYEKAAVIVSTEEKESRNGTTYYRVEAGIDGKTKWFPCFDQAVGDVAADSHGKHAILYIKRSQAGERVFENLVGIDVDEGDDEEVGVETPTDESLVTDDDFPGE